MIAAIMRFADGQRGLITHSQLLHCGLDRFEIKRLVERGWLRPVLRGVYLVGHAAEVNYMRETAVVLAYAPSSKIAHRSSLTLWRVLPAANELDVHVLVLGRRARRREGVVVHHAERLADCDLGHCQRLPVTMPARALLEAACDLGLHETEKAVDEALALGLVDRPGLLAVLDRYPGHRGAKIIRQLADPNGASEITRSEAEKRLSLLLRKVKAPPSQTQYRIGPYKADRCWPELKLIIEVDGVKFHRDGKRMEKDNTRQDNLRRMGYVVVRFTRRQIVYEPEWVAFRIAEELTLAAAAVAAGQ